MKLLRVAQNVYPDVKGGGSYHVHAMSRDQGEMGHDVTVLTVDGEVTGQRQEDRIGYRIVRRSPNIELLGNELSVGVGRYLRRADEFDVIHAHSHYYFSTILAAVASQFTDTPLVVTNHGLYSQSAPKSVFEVYLRTVGSRVLNAADTVLTYTPVERERLIEYGVESPITVVQNGVNIDMFTRFGPMDDRVSGDPAVLFAGRLVDGKCPVDAVRAVARLRDRRPGATLTICGSGPKSTAIDTAAQDLGISHAVRQLGHVPYETMPALYRAADVVLLPSRTEGLPRTILEALASGTPVVTSDLEQLRSVVDGVGETAPVGDTDRFAAALDVVVAGTARPPHEAVNGTYSWRRTVTETTDVLRRVADGEIPGAGDDRPDGGTEFRGES
jgi:glycogen(starch) synthase